ncbi:MAG: glycosyl hydrolase family 18 protein [Lachnospiraceae bacterium]
MAIYIVQSGDSVDSIANQFFVDVSEIIYDNQLIYPYELALGQALFIGENSSQGGQNQSTQEEEASNERRSLRVNGYAYPFISEWVLEQTLPYLTELSIFSYGFSEEGELIPPVISENRMIELAHLYGVIPVLTLTPLGPDGRFNNNLITSVVNDAQKMDRLIEEILLTMQRMGYGGLDIDFEFILKEDRDAFTSFVALCVERLHAANPYYRVSVALAPKTSATQQGLLYEGKDYAGLGAVADSVLLMTYEWGYTYGPPMAVAPINKVREVVTYAITEIPVNKIYLGIPNYGYDWPLPFVAGTTRARTLGNIEAVRIAVHQGATIQFDEIAKSPYFRYEQDGIEHEVWFEDVRSIQAKFDLIKEFNLLGAGYWNVMQLFRANWLLLNENFIII